MFTTMISHDSKRVLTNAFENYTDILVHNVISNLSQKYGFDMDEALRFIRNGPDNESDMEEDEYKRIDKSEVIPTSEKEQVEEQEPEVLPSGQPEEQEKEEEEEEVKEIPYIKTSYPVPYYGQLYNTCYGVKTNHDLYTQCTNKRIKNASHNYCKTCLKQSMTNDNKLPNAGNIILRQKSKIDEYRDVRNKRCKPYGAFLKKMKVTREDAEKEFKEHGIEIPEELWAETWSNDNKPKNKSKSKSKSIKKEKVFTPKTAVSDTDEDTESDKENTNTDKDNTNTDKENTDTDTDTDKESTNTESDKEKKCKIYEAEGQKFIISEDNIVYDIDTEEDIGIFKDNEIILN